MLVGVASKNPIVLTTGIVVVLLLTSAVRVVDEIPPPPSITEAIIVLNTNTNTKNVIHFIILSIYPPNSHSS